MPDPKSTAALALTPRAAKSVAEEMARSRQPEPDPVGRCPLCHGALERRQATQPIDISTAIMGSVPARLVVLTYWGCLNELCCAMFWRQPRMASDEGDIH